MTNGCDYTKGNYRLNIMVMCILSCFLSLLLIHMPSHTIRHVHTVWLIPYFLTLSLCHAHTTPPAQGHFMYVSNLEEYGHLLNRESYTTEHLHNDMYQLFDNRLVSVVSVPIPCYVVPVPIPCYVVPVPIPCYVVPVPIPCYVVPVPIPCYVVPVPIPCYVVPVPIPCYVVPVPIPCYVVPVPIPCYVVPVPIPHYVTSMFALVPGLGEEIHT